MAPNQTSLGRSPVLAQSSRHPATHKSPQPWVLTINLYREEERLKTFIDWPVSFLSPEEFAADGFYYTRRSDVVRCVFCGVEVGQWVQGDDVHADHQKWAPSCDMVQGRPCGNIPIGGLTPDSSPSSSPPSYDECGPYGHLIRPFSGPERACGSIPGALLNDLEHLGVSRTTGPCKPRYSTDDARLRTFDNWPQDSPVSGAALSEAGFYYNGTGDHTICFHCGGGLKDWEAGDDPWVEHARWFSRCAFVLMHKGRDFVVNVAKTTPALLSAQAVGELLDQEVTERSGETPSAQSAELEKKEENIKPKSAQTVTPVVESERNLRDVELCKICYGRERAIVFLPCGHFVSCASCAAVLSNCPVCRKPFEATLRAFLS